MPLKGIKVIELAGLAPGPFCGQILCDFGADVIQVDKAFARNEMENMKRGKKLILIDLKTSDGKEIFENLCKSADVLIDVFRPGVMERLSLGPDSLTALNPKLIYARISGYGQSGNLSKKAGHDINYLAISGILSKLGPKNIPLAPINILGDFAGGGLMAAFGICLALFERSRSGIGQIIDANLTEGVSYLCSWVWESHEDNWKLRDKAWPLPDQRQSNLYDGGCPYNRCYETKDKKFMAVGAQEYKFYKTFVEYLGMEMDELELNRNQFSNWIEMNEKIENIFATKTQREWCDVFEKVDGCVTPVLDMKAAHLYKHHIERNSHFSNGRPKPSPILSRTPASPLKENNTDFERNYTKEILLKYGYNELNIKYLSEKIVIEI